MLVGDTEAKLKGLLFKGVVNNFHKIIGDIECRIEVGVIWHLTQLTV